jgi:hypothetical protein
MPYLVRADIHKPGKGTFNTEAETIQAALEKARSLRAQGIVVEITDPNGWPIDETKLVVRF